MTISVAMDRLMKNARVHLPGAIDANLQLELFNVLVEFFDTSNVWKTDITVPVIGGTTTYTLPPPAPSTILRLINLVNDAGLQVPATMAIPGTLVLNSTPTVIATLTATVSLSVDDPVDSDSYPVFPAWILDKYDTGILDGLIARMMAQPAKPYTNSTMAAFRMRKFNGVVSQAKAEALHKNINNGQTWRFPQTFARRRH